MIIEEACNAMLKGDLRKQAILDTAEKLFFEKGYVKATIQDFLDALNCSKGSFYHHYESKLQVLMELCRQKAGGGFEQYGEKQFDDALEQLNALIYFAMPFRDGEEQTIALLLPLVDLTDGKMVMDAMLDAHKAVFFPELCAVLETLRALSSRLKPFARFAAMALERVQPVPWVLGLSMRCPSNH